MPDLLIRNFPEDDLARLDEHATRLGISRSEYLRRQLLSEARRISVRVTVDDLRRLATLAQDLQDDDVLRAAWS